MAFQPLSCDKFVSKATQVELGMRTPLKALRAGFETARSAVSLTMQGTDESWIRSPPRGLGVGQKLSLESRVTNAAATASFNACGVTAPFS
jgi:hypothetical protein